MAHEDNALLPSCEAETAAPGIGRAVAGLRYLDRQLDLARGELLARQEGRPSAVICCRSCKHFIHRMDPKLRSNGVELEHQCGPPQAGHYATGVKV